MADIWSKEKRSEVMGRVRSRGNKSTELKLIEMFKESGIIGWRRNFGLVGKPDFVFPKSRVAVFVDGCFWHGCPKCYRRPKSNQKYWDEKVQANRSRDKDVNRQLKKKNWKVIRIWEHQLKESRHAVLRVHKAITS